VIHFFKDLFWSFIYSIFPSIFLKKLVVEMTLYPFLMCLILPERLNHCIWICRHHAPGQLGYNCEEQEGKAPQYR